MDERPYTGSQALAGVLRRHREALGVSQHRLGKMTAVHASTIHKIETGKRSMGLGVVMRLAQVLGEQFKREVERAETDRR